MGKWLSIGFLCWATASIAWAGCNGGDNVKNGWGGPVIGIMYGCTEGARKYLKYVPKGYQPGDGPLLVALHGATQTGAAHERNTDVPKLLASKGKSNLVVIYPSGDNKHWNDGRQNKDGGDLYPNDTVSDKNFLTALIDKTKTEHDSTGVFIWGMSNGGIMTLEMVCNSGYSFNGAAVVSASQYEAQLSSCTGNQTKILFVLGREDKVMHDRLKAWQTDKSSRIVRPKPKRDGTGGSWARSVDAFCSGLTAKAGTPLGSGDDIVYRKDGCGGKVRYFDVVAGGHKWFNGKNSFLGNTKVINAGKEALSFFGIF